MDDKITVTKTAEVPPGVYWMKIINQEKFDSNWSPARRLYFELDPRYKIEGHITGIFPEMATSGNKTGVLIRACFGDCQVGEQYTWSDMVGVCVYGKVEQNAKPEGLFSKVANIVWPPPREEMNAPANVEPPKEKQIYPVPEENKSGGLDVPF